MLIEIRRYSIQPGRRPELVRFFDESVAPAMTEAGITILASFESLDDPDVFVYLRGFADQEQRHRLTSAFHGSEAWQGGLRDRALAMEVDYQVEVVRSTPRSPM